MSSELTVPSPTVLPSQGVGAPKIALEPCCSELRASNFHALPDMGYASGERRIVRWVSLGTDGDGAHQSSEDGHQKLSAERLSPPRVDGAAMSRHSQRRFDGKPARVSAP